MLKDILTKLNNLSLEELKELQAATAKEITIKRNGFTQLELSIESSEKEIKAEPLVEEIFNELEAIYKDLKEKRAVLFNSTVGKVVAGIMPIEFGIVGCDYPYYQPWVRDLDKDLEGKEQAIMEYAIKQLAGKDVFVSNSCEYIEKRLKQSICSKEKMNEKAFDLGYNSETQNYHGYNDSVVTSFKMKLSDAIKLDELLEARENKETAKQLIFDKAKETGERQLLQKWSEHCNDPKEECNLDMVYIYAMPDGTTKQERHHTW